MFVKALVLNAYDCVDQVLRNILVVDPKSVFASVQGVVGKKHLISGIVNVIHRRVEVAVEFEVVKPFVVRIDVVLYIQRKGAAYHHAGDYYDEYYSKEYFYCPGKKLAEYEKQHLKRVPKCAFGNQRADPACLFCACFEFNVAEQGLFLFAFGFPVVVHS